MPSAIKVADEEQSWERESTVIVTKGASTCF